MAIFVRVLQLGILEAEHLIFLNGLEDLLAVLVRNLLESALFFVNQIQGLRIPLFVDNYAVLTVFASVCGHVLVTVPAAHSD